MTDKNNIDKVTKAAINLDDHGDDCACTQCDIDRQTIDNNQDTVGLLSTVFNALFPQNN
ncbi:MAG: hypothetical protein WBF90_33840 [Rivularia sp. (in: cyanobacteria)]